MGPSPGFVVGIRAKFPSKVGSIPTGGPCAPVKEDVWDDFSFDGILRVGCRWLFVAVEDRVPRE